MKAPPISSRKTSAGAYGWTIVAALLGCLAVGLTVMLLLRLSALISVGPGDAEAGAETSRAFAALALCGILLLIPAVFAYLGYLIAAPRGQALAGVILGLLFGPIGLLACFFLPQIDRPGESSVVVVARPAGANDGRKTP